MQQRRSSPVSALRHSPIKSIKCLLKSPSNLLRLQTKQTLLPASHRVQRPETLRIVTRCWHCCFISSSFSSSSLMRGAKVPLFFFLATRPTLVETFLLQNDSWQRCKKLPRIKRCLHIREKKYIFFLLIPFVEFLAHVPQAAVVFSPSFFLLLLKISAPKTKVPGV